MEQRERQTTAKALFGGSFDPVHLGHLAMAEVAKRRVALESVTFLPAFRSPFKEGTVASPEQRVTMLRLALEAADFGWAEISEYEIEKTGASYSWETAMHFAKKEPATKWHWILGTDQWDQIDRWAEPDFLRDTLHFIVMRRSGSEVRERKGWQYTAVDFDHPASSRAIRAGLEQRSDWLSPAVYEYCLAKGLYD